DIPISWAFALPDLDKAPAPDWAARPSEADLASAYPEIPRLLRLAGQASLRCAADADGALSACEGEAEAPPGRRCGGAGERPAAKYGPALKDGARAEGAVVPVTVRWTPALLPPADPTEPGLPDGVAGDWAGEAPGLATGRLVLHLKPAPATSSTE